MADIELDHFRQPRDGKDIGVIQPVTAVHLQTQTARQGGCGGDLLQLDSPIPGSVAITSGMELDAVRPDLTACRDLLLLRIDKQAHPDASPLESLHGVPDLTLVRAHIEPAFRRQLLAALRHETGVVRTKPFGQADHLGRHRHLQIDLGTSPLAQELHIPLLNMPPVLPQMDGDPVRPALLGEQRRLHRIRDIDPPRLPHGSNMVDIDT